MGKRIAAIVIALAVGVGSVTLIESFSSLLFPAPENIDWNDAAALKQFIDSLPVVALLFVLIAHAFGALVAAMTCAAVVKQPWLGGTLIVGSTFQIAGIINLTMIPHPAWFSVIDIALYFPSALAGGLIAMSTFNFKTSDPPSEEP